METSSMAIDIETCVYVALWEEPLSVFQGYFELSTANKKSIQIGFRCERSPRILSHLKNYEFKDFHYVFTHLYPRWNFDANSKNDLCPEEISSSFDDQVLYCLGYALHLTLNQLKQHQTKCKQFFDKHVMDSMHEKMKSLMENRQWNLAPKDLGFSVIVPFIPVDKEAQSISESLLLCIDSAYTDVGCMTTKFHPSNALS